MIAIDNQEKDISIPFINKWLFIYRDLNNAWHKYKQSAGSFYMVFEINLKFVEIMRLEEEPLKNEIMDNFRKDGVTSTMMSSIVSDLLFEIRRNIKIYTKKETVFSSLDVGKFYTDRKKSIILDLDRATDPDREEELTLALEKIEAIKEPLHSWIYEHSIILRNFISKFDGPHINNDEDDSEDKGNIAKLNFTSPSNKIVALHELGIITHLRNKYKGITKTDLAGLISGILGVEDRETIRKHIGNIDTNSDKSPITGKSILAVKVQLAKVGIDLKILKDSTR